MGRYPAVLFEFVSATKPATAARGVVIARGAEMVLEVECPGDRPYLIRGADRGGHFAGVHEGLPGDVPVHARWARLDDRWVGVWHEDGWEYLFTFRLPPAAGTEGG
jgi:hypothetical protein